ncbi:MAG: OstA-like protein [Balneolaceae bacterium]|nr:OstA-like protein [Balneolaceae bacterium]
MDRNRLRITPARRLPAFPALTALLVLLATALPAEAQQRVNILDSESVTDEMVDGEPVQEILGDVHLRMGDFEMYCDSAYRFFDRAEVRAYGNIEIITAEERIWADSLAYFTDLDFSQLRGRVIIRSDSTTLFGNSVDYRFSTKVGHFLDGVRLEDPQGVLRANSGFYHREADSAVFRGEVQLADSTQYLEGDSLFTNRSTGYYKLYGQIYARDTENRSTLTGRYLEADSTGRRLLRGDAWLRRVSADTLDADSADSGPLRRPDPIPRDADSTGTPHPAAGISGAVLPDSVAGRLEADAELPDSLREALPDSLDAGRADSLGARPPDGLFPDTLYAASRDSAPEVRRDTTHIMAREILMRRQAGAQGDTVNTVDARDSVRIWSPRFSSLSDSARYDGGSETFELHKEPRAWYRNIQLSGPYIRVELQGSQVERLVSHTRPFAVQQDTAIGRLNQITGDTLTADFSGGALHRIRVWPEGRLLRYFVNDEGQPDGAIELSASDIRILFEEGQLVEMRVLEQPRGFTLPESEDTAKRRLEGFRWEPDLRPSRPAQPMERRFPTIPAERPFELPPRYLDFISSQER